MQLLVVGSTNCDFTRVFSPSSLTLFRYSALTFNSHLIHYDHRYATEVEGYPKCLVHGPLTCTLLLDLLAKNTNGFSKLRLTKFTYRALSPLYVGDPIHLKGKWIKGDKNETLCELWACNNQGALAMKGTAELQPTSGF